MICFPPLFPALLRGTSAKALGINIKRLETSFAGTDMSELSFKYSLMKLTDNVVTK